ncbi:hypothetical protein [Micromonospora sp. NPDC050200]|uniref:hypothetical protein n=1 Tax=Micromonospora sp. NPDC050200 TaxID=3155664 RepID=UPI0033DE1122
MTGLTRTAWSTVPTEEERYRPLYARALGLRVVNPGGVLCFLFFEGAVALAVLLALAELVSWWAVVLLPVAVALMVKLNDMVAERVVCSAALVPEQERDRFRRQMEPVVGRARVPRTLPGVVVAAEPAPMPPWERPQGAPEWRSGAGRWPEGPDANSAGRP